MTEPADMVPARKPSGQVPFIGRVDPESRSAQLRAQAAAEIVMLLVRGGHVFLDTKTMEAETIRNWEATRQRIAELDATTRSELKKLEVQLRGQKEKTLRLRLVLDVIASKGDTLPEAYSKGLTLAVEQLTRE